MQKVKNTVILNVNSVLIQCADAVIYRKQLRNIFIYIYIYMCVCV
jgi:hypothetical protein